jgi:hypothetical protein
VERVENSGRNAPERGSKPKSTGKVKHPMAKEPKEGKKPAKEAPVEAAPSDTAAENGSSAPKTRTAIDDVIAAIEAARDKVMADEVKGLTKLGIPRPMAYQMVAARFHQNVVTDGDSGTPEFENSHWNDR